MPIVCHCQTGSQRKLHTTLALTVGEFQMEAIMEYGRQRDLLEKLPQTVDTVEISTSVLQKLPIIRILVI